MLLLLCLLLYETSAYWLNDLDLPDHHIPYHLHGNAELRRRCMGDGRCPHKEALRAKDLCWGYESNCLFRNSFSFELIQCNDTNDDDKETFWSHIDFGFLKKKRQSLKQLCISSSSSAQSSLVCTTDLTFCKADTFLLDLSTFNATVSRPHRKDVLPFGAIKMACDSMSGFMNAQYQLNKHGGFLADWSFDMHNYKYFKAKFQGEVCDLEIVKPTIILKPDSWFNMYHHFCDFLNLYLTQHLNGTFDRDVQLIFWDTTDYGYKDTLFNIGWSVFSKHVPIQLISLAGKRICFKSAIFALPPRMHNGLYYQTPMVGSCQRSGLLRAFTDHMLHRLKIKTERRNRKLKITILLRKTGWRQVNNTEEILAQLNMKGDVDIEAVSFDRFDRNPKPFIEQLRLIHNTDILVGMHGAGLTHLLFLPPSAALLEIFDCDDGCYRDLARMKGIYYETLAHDKVSVVEQGRDNLGRPSAKFANYRVHATELADAIDRLSARIRADHHFIDFLGQTTTHDDDHPRQRPHEL